MYVVCGNGTSYLHGNGCKAFDWVMSENIEKTCNAVTHGCREHS